MQRFAFAACAVFLCATSVVQGFYFYLDTSSTKCFLEELAKETMVLGEYRSEQWDKNRDGFVENPKLGIYITVTEKTSGHVIKDQKGASSGRIAFHAPVDDVQSPSIAVTDMYELCFSTNNSGWFAHERARIHFDLVTGEGAQEKSNMGEKVSELALRVRDLNHRIADIRREQQYQKTREAEFRDKSESTNSKVVWWTIAQFIVLGLTAYWQSRHLRSFFVAKKLV